MKTTHIVIGMIFLALAQISFAQDDAAWPGRPRYPDGQLKLGAGFGATKYVGEFEDEQVGYGASFSATYALYPYLGVGLYAGFGELFYTRRPRRESFVYDKQFGSLDAADVSTSYSTLGLRSEINFFPDKQLNAYLILGAGATLYSPSAYEDNSVTIKPNRNHFASASAIGGLGTELYLGRNTSLDLEVTYTALFVDDLDAFPSSELATIFGSGDNRNPEGNDGFITLSIGLRWHLFENDDLDDDRLFNLEEEQLGTNPYDSDSDKDMLSDYDEIRVHGTDPLREDTDGDGLPDRDEVGLYGTDPNTWDTDGDGLSDYSELKEYDTDPVNPDTDGETLADGEEVYSRGTNPLSRDSDGDGILDNEDSCPLEKEIYNDFLDDDGCPDTRTGGTAYAYNRRVDTVYIRVPGNQRTDTLYMRVGGSFTLDGVNFETGEATLLPGSIPVLEANLVLFRQYPDLIIEIRGHTDSVGKRDANMKLSRERSAAVRRWYIEKGIQPGKMISTGYGERMPIASNGTRSGRAKNRRTEFHIVSMGDNLGSKQ